MSLDLKELINKLVNAMVIANTETYTGTTSAYGAIDISSKVDSSATVIAVTSSNNAHLCIPWLYLTTSDELKWFVKVVNWQNMSAITNTSVTLTIRYIA